jgi:hypothetical protein
MFVVQTAHYAEHVAQMIQIYSLRITPALARGLLGSVFDFEWVHFLYNVGLEIVLIQLWFGYRSTRRTAPSSVSIRGTRILAGLIVFQGYHSIEHIAKMYEYLFLPVYQTGLFPPPGILPYVTGWPIFLVHFWLNTIVWVTMVVTLWYLRPRVALQEASAR